MPSKKAKANRPAGKAARSPNRDALERFREDPEGQLLTTDQGLRVLDDQNSLKAGPRGPSLLEVSSSGRRSPTLTTSGSRSESSTPGAPRPTATSRSSGP